MSQQSSLAVHEASIEDPAASYDADRLSITAERTWRAFPKAVWPFALSSLWADGLRGLPPGLGCHLGEWQAHVHGTSFSSGAIFLCLLRTPAAGTQTRIFIRPEMPRRMDRRLRPCVIFASLDSSTSTCMKRCAFRRDIFSNRFADFAIRGRHRMPFD